MLFSMLSVVVGVLLALLQTIPLFVMVVPPLLVITPPAVALVVVMLVRDEVVMVGVVGGVVSFLQAVTNLSGKL